MKFKFTSLIAVFVMSCSSVVHAEDQRTSIQKEKRSSLYAQLVGFQPRAAGGAAFLRAMGSDIRNPRWLELSRATSKMNNWPALKIVNNAVVVSDGTNSSTFEISNVETGEIKIDGRIFSPNEKKPILPQIESFLKRRDSKSVRWNFFVPQADAQGFERSTKAMMIPVVLGAGYVATQLVFGAPVAFVAVGAAAGAAVGSVACLAAQLDRFGETFGTRYLNCLAAPLSLVGLNPRDDMKVKKFEICSNEKISVRLQSANGITQLREFDFSQDTLQEVRMTETAGPKVDPHTVVLKVNTITQSFKSGVSKKGESVIAKLPDSQLDRAQALFRDAAYYQQLCRNPQQMKLIESKLAESETANNISPIKVHERTVQ